MGFTSDPFDIVLHKNMVWHGICSKEIIKDNYQNTIDYAS